MRAKEFITEASYRPGKRSAPAHHFERSHPGLIMPGEQGDVYWGRYYDFYRAACLAGMDPEEIESISNEQLEKTFKTNIFQDYIEKLAIENKNITFNKIN